MKQFIGSLLHTSNDQDNGDKLMLKTEVKIRLCQLTSEVGSNVYKNGIAYDCWCDSSTISESSYQFNEKVLIFIEDAVHEAITKVEKSRNNSN